jgi:hypothetical protein
MIPSLGDIVPAANPMNERTNLHDYEEAAREVLPGMVYDYYAGGGRRHRARKRRVGTGAIAPPGAGRRQPV